MTERNQATPEATTVTAPKYMTAQETCKLVGIGRTSLYNKVKAGTFPKPCRIGPPPSGHLRFVRSEVEQWLEVNCREAV